MRRSRPVMPAESHSLSNHMLMTLETSDSFRLGFKLLPPGNKGLREYLASPAILNLHDFDRRSRWRSSDAPNPFINNSLLQKVQKPSGTVDADIAVPLERSMLLH